VTASASAGAVLASRSSRIGKSPAFVVPWHLGEHLTRMRSRWPIRKARISQSIQLRVQMTYASAEDNVR